MCGIGFCKKCELNDGTIELLKRRGPDCYNTKRIEKQELIFYGSVLSQQGIGIQSQPLEAEDIILLFNGEIYDHPELVRKDNEISDSLWLSQKISSYKWNIDEILLCLSKIKGEFAFVVYNKIENEILFGRDRLGRRSLLISAYQDQFRLVSVGEDNSLLELPADGLYFGRVNDLLQLKRFRYEAGTIVESHHLKEFIFLNSLKSLVDIDRVLEEDAQTINIEDAKYTDNNYPSYWTFSQNFTGNSEEDYKTRVSKAFENSIYRRVKYHKGNIGILFSGGLDCSLVAYYTLKYIADQGLKTQVDLFSVAFGKGEEDYEKCPDRITANSSFEQIRFLFPSAHLSLVKINISKSDLEKKRKTVIKHLINPRVSVLDDSIGSALWFAAQGKSNEECTVLLSGLGADELFCGYSQHRRIHDREGIEALGLDVQNMIERIAERNCGRDDRVISDSGRELRLPFLDLDFIQTGNNNLSAICDFDVIFVVSNVPITNRCNLTLERGEGEKLLLRQIAREIGLDEISKLEKRAIQFGSRIAKMTKTKQKGNYISPDLL